jgi:hypothetical protein
MKWNLNSIFIVGKKFYKKRKFVLIGKALSNDFKFTNSLSMITILNTGDLAPDGSGKTDSCKAEFFLAMQNDRRKFLHWLEKQALQRRA